MRQEKIWDYYQNEGGEYDYFSEARQRFMLKYLEPGQSVLNVGVGVGSLERLALHKGINIFALDPSQGAIEKLKKALDLGDRAQTGYAQTMPFDDGQFDAVVMSEVLEHLDDGTLQASLCEVLRVLKPGGFVLISTPYGEKLEAGKVVCPDCGKVFHRWGHVQSFDKERMRRVVAEQGFAIDEIRVTTFVDWQRKGLANVFKSLVRVLMARLKQQIADPHLILIARKLPRNG